MKKVVAMLLAALMVLSVLPAAAFAYESSAVPVWPAEGSIKLEKDAEAVGGENSNLWEVTLSIQGKNYKTTSDVVLVIDCSGSMDGSKLTNTRKAAKAFGEKLLDKGSSTRIAIVTYIDEAAAYNNGHFYTADELAAFNTAVDAATYADGGTNQQAGIHKAQELLTSAVSTGKTKSIVILSDGEATYSYPFVGGSASIDCRNFLSHRFSGNPRVTTWPANAVPDYTTVVGTGGDFSLDGNILWNCKCEHNRTTNELYGSFYYDADGNFVCSNGNRSSNNGVATIWEANKAKAAGTAIYSVALQAGANGEATLKACASDAAKGYFAIAANETDVAGKLTEAFTSIAGSIAIAARNGVVNDTMGEKVDLKFNGSEPVITTEEAVYNAGNADIYISQGTATWDSAARKINWNVGDVREGDAPTLKYKVTVRAGYTVVKNETLFTNESAEFNYTDYKDEKVKGEFPKPQVTVGGGKILVHYYMVNGNGEPINENGIVVASPSLAKQLKTAEYFAVDGSTALEYNKPYTVAKTDLGGYTYAGKYILNNDALTAGDFATVTLSATNSNQHVWFAYTQEFTVVHVKESGSTSEKFSVSAGFDMTEHVTEGYLYGGTFDNAECTTVSDFGGGNPTDFMPKAGETYYIWEVDREYLMPKSLSCWEHVDATNVDVTGFYLVTPIDRTYYSKVGFKVGGEKLKANQLTEEYMQNGEKATLIKDGEQSVVYDKIIVDCKSTRTEVFDITSVTNKTKGSLACYSMNKVTYWNEVGATVTFTPYWITLDGVEVTGSATRTCEYKGAGSDADTTYKKVGKVSEVAAAVEPVFTSADNANGLTLLSAFIADGVQMNPAAPTEPEKPIEPTEPKQPTEPEQPIEPTEPEQPEKPEQPSNEINVIVHDAGETYTVTVAKGDIHGEIEHIGADDKLFAGWYYDEHCKKVADLADITEDTEIHAKYVSTSYLQVKYIENFFFRNRGIYLISAVDGRDFAETGFIINGEAFTASGSNRNVHYSASYLFGRDVSRNARLIVEDYSLYGVEEGTELVVVPYWVTADGTTVYGTERVLTVGRYGIEG